MEKDQGKRTQSLRKIEEVPDSLIESALAEMTRKHSIMTPLARRYLGAFSCAALLFCSAPLHADELSDIDSMVNKGNFAQALERVNTFLTSRPKDPQGRFLKGIILTELSKPTEAIQVFTGLTEDYPQLPEPYNNLAVLYASQGQYDKARVALELAIHTHPSYATAHENLGDIYAKLASRAYDKALQLDKSNAGAQNKLALIKDLFGGKGQRTVIAQAAPTPAPPPAAPKPQPAAAPPTPTVVAQAKPEPPKPAEQPKPVEAAKPVEPPKPVAEAPKPPPEPAKPVETAKPPEPPKPAEAAKPPEPAPPVAAPKPEPTPTATVAAPSRGDDVNAIVSTVESWAKAWSTKDVTAYLSFYGAQFQPGEGMSRRAWESNRRQRINKPGAISVQISDTEVVFEGNDAATVRFVQAYRSSNLSSTNRKSLRLVRNGQQWQIQQERVGG